MRIAKNHAQLIALAHALAGVVPLPDGALQDTEDTLVDMAIERQKAINADHPMVQEFWELFDYLNGEDTDPKLNHSKDPTRTLAINLNHFVQVADGQRQQIPPLADLKKHLKTSKARKYQCQKPVASALWDAGEYSKRPRTVKCWVFKRDGVAA